MYRILLVILIGFAGFLKSDELYTVAFDFQPMISGVEQVYLAGSFNDWKSGELLMTDPDQDGMFQTHITLPPGRYLYKFVVDGKWLTDPNAQDYESDGHGGRNAVILVDSSFARVTFERGDGSILTTNIPLDVSYRMIHPFSPDSFYFQIPVHRKDIQSAELYISKKGERMQYTLRKTGHDEKFEYWGTHLSVQAPFSFTFLLTDADAEVYATKTGWNSVPAADSMWLDCDSNKLPTFFVPDWVQSGVFYQIFPERFRNGNPDNDPDFTEPYYQGHTELPADGKTNDEYYHLIRDWYDIDGLSKSPYRTDGRPDYYSFYGGDIPGVHEKLDYLVDLGITIIYFNPLNAGKSNHKYDPVDYLTIDPHFATENEFIDFVNAAHKHGIRIIVDMAFNHTGDWHYAFVDTREKGPESRYWHWYEWNKWPLPPEGCPTPCDYYDCWWGFPLHPNLNFDLSRPNDQENDFYDICKAEPNQEVVNYILNVARYWLGSLGIDGFRLDVPNEVPFWFWKEFRAVVDSVNPDAFLIGEIWGDALPWLGQDCFHGTMNYKYFREPVLDFFARRTIDAQIFVRRLAPAQFSYPLQARRAMMNLMGSHDTKRFITLADDNIRQVKLAALFQMSYVGVPHIYYGDEIGLHGGADPDNRRTFPWNWKKDDWRRGLFEYYQQLIELRRNHAALVTGTYEPLFAQRGLVAFARRSDSERFVIALNNSADSDTLRLSERDMGASRLSDLLSEITYKAVGDTLVLPLQPFEGMLLK
ncbi:MAG: alpha-amylase family glycosyl hydrolase [candidate division KSB1 bacterium]|nr:alpha-amylase family glycosyl hydrolase [candidate division KSB1 bacterium]